MFSREKSMNKAQNLSLSQSKVALQSVLPVVGMAAVTAVAAQVTVPWWPVPITLQTLAVMAAGVALGAKKGAASQVVYLAAGALGAPVFAGLGAGPLHLAGPTAGYLLFFPVLAYLFGLAAERRGSISGWLIAGAASLATLVVGGLVLSGFVGAKAWTVGVLPFLLAEPAKAILAMAGSHLRRKSA